MTRPGRPRARCATAPIHELNARTLDVSLRSGPNEHHPGDRGHQLAVDLGREAEVGHALPHGPSARAGALLCGEQLVERIEVDVTRRHTDDRVVFVGVQRHRAHEARQRIAT